MWLYVITYKGRYVYRVYNEFQGHEYGFTAYARLANTFYTYQEAEEFLDECYQSIPQPHYLELVKISSKFL